MSRRVFFGVDEDVTPAARDLLNKLEIGELGYIINLFASQKVYPNTIAPSDDKIKTMEVYITRMAELVAKYQSLTTKTSSVLTPFSVVEALETVNMDVRSRRCALDGMLFGIPLSAEEEAARQQQIADGVQQVTEEDIFPHVEVRDIATGTVTVMPATYEFMNYESVVNEKLIKEPFIEQCAHAAFYAAMFTKLEKGKIVANYTMAAVTRMKANITPSVSGDLCRVLNGCRARHPHLFDKIISVAGYNWASVVYRIIQEEDADERVDVVCSLLYGALQHFPAMLVPVPRSIRDRILAVAPKYSVKKLVFFKNTDNVPLRNWKTINASGAHYFLSESRNFRGKDEDGMSALSFPFYSRMFVSKQMGRRMQHATQLTNLRDKKLVIAGVDACVASSMLETLRKHNFSFKFEGLRKGSLGDAVFCQSVISNMEEQTLFDFSPRTYPEKAAKTSFPDYAVERFQDTADYAGKGFRYGATTVIVFTMGLHMPKKCSIDGKQYNVFYGLATAPHNMVIPVAFSTSKISPFLRTYDSEDQWLRVTATANVMRNTYFRHRSYIGVEFAKLGYPWLSWVSVPPNIATAEMKLTFEEFNLFARNSDMASIIGMDMGIERTAEEKQELRQRKARKIHPSTEAEDDGEDLIGDDNGLVMPGGVSHESEGESEESEDEDIGLGFYSKT